MVKTSSVWGPAPARTYRLARELPKGAKSKVAVLGCADGKFVMPFARKGMQVIAVDCNSIYLSGGVIGKGKNRVDVVGLRARLIEEGLSDRVRVIKGDYTRARPPWRSDLVLTSGSFHYRYNNKKSTRALLRGLLRFAKPSGLVYFDYMMPVSEPDKEVRHYYESDQLIDELESFGCKIIHHRSSAPWEDEPHVGTPFPHFHKVGYIKAIAPRHMVD